MPAVYFVDTSALVKRYVIEDGTAWLRRVLAPSTGCTVYIVRITGAEVIAALTRRERGGSLVPADADAARQAFRSDVATEYQAIEVTAAVVERAMHLAEKHGLRGYDSVQLAAALNVNDRYVGAGLPPIKLICSDVELNTAAAAEGFHFDDPNTHR